MHNGPSMEIAHALLALYLVAAVSLCVTLYSMTAGDCISGIGLLYIVSDSDHIFKFVPVKSL